MQQNRDFISAGKNTTDGNNVLSENTRKLRFTFSKVLPVLQITGGMVAFYCKERLQLMVFSILDGEMVVESIGSERLVETAIRLNHEGIIVNRVDAVQMRRIVQAFSHIRTNPATVLQQSFSDRIHEIQSDIQKLKDDILHLFKANYAI